MTEQDILSRSFTLFDGATGTEYFRHGAPSCEPCELVTLSRPDLVERVHRAYIDAGAQVIESNTFGGNRKRLSAHGIEKELVRINTEAATLALRCAEGKALVAGSVGPLGEFIEPYGDLTHDEAVAVFQEQIGVLLNAGIDFILIETMTSLAEALAALEAARNCSAHRIAVTMTFHEGGNGVVTLFGEKPGDVAAALREGGAHIIGANCGSGLDLMRTAGRELLATGFPHILLQPNAGIPSVKDDGRLEYPVTPEEFADFVSEMAAMGIRSIGGCCGATPDHIRAAKKAMSVGRSYE